LNNPWKEVAVEVICEIMVPSEVHGYITKGKGVKGLNEAIAKAKENEIVTNLVEYEYSSLSWGYSIS
jgi:hypothetical protein